MAKPERIAEYRRQIYNIGKTEAEKNLAAQLKKKGTAIETLQKDAQKNAAAIAQLQKEYAELDRYAKNIEEQAQDLARRYAPINLDDAAPLYREAFGAFQKGDLEKARQILRGADLIGQADKILAEREAIGTIRKEADSRDSVQAQRTKDLLQVLGLKADLHKAQFESDSTRYCYKLMLQLDSNNVKNLWDFAYFLSNQNEKQKAITYYEKALALSKSDELKGIFYNNMGIAYKEVKQPEEAKKCYLLAFDIFDRLSKINPVQFEPLLGQTAINLGEFYRIYKNIDIAKIYYSLALDIFERLARDSVQYVPLLAKTTMDLGIFYNGIINEDTANVQKAESYYLQSLNIYVQLVQKDSVAFEPDLANVKFNLGKFYTDFKQIVKAEKYS